MSRLRITCKAPHENTRGLQFFADMSHTHVTLIADDGTEQDISRHFAEMTWSVKANEIASATVVMYPDEVDLEGVSRLLVAERAFRGFDWKLDGYDWSALAKFCDGAVEYFARVAPVESGVLAMVTRNGHCLWSQVFQSVTSARDGANKFAKQAIAERGDLLV